MPETPFHDGRDDEAFDRVLRVAGARMRAATETAQPTAVDPTGPSGTRHRWIVPVAIVTATAAAVVAAVWIAGPATETVRDAPADTGVAATPDSAVDSLPVVAPIGSTPPSDTTPNETPPASPAPDPAGATVTVTDADFDGAGGTCLRFHTASDTADGCFTHDQLSSNPTWLVAFTDGIFEVTVNAVDPTKSFWTPVGACGDTLRSFIQARWLVTSCGRTGLWFVAAPETPTGASTTYVVLPRTGEPVALEPIDSALPDGFVAYRASAEIDGVNMRCLVVASFPDQRREACGDWSEAQRLLVPIGGTAFVVDAAPDLESVEVTDIATLSLPLVGCTAPVADMAAAIPETSVMISGLICAGDSAMAIVLSVNSQSGPPDGAGYPLQRATDGTWATAGGGMSFPCDVDPPPACAALGTDGDLMAAPLPIPPWGLIGAREHDLDPVEVTAEIQSLTGDARTPDEIGSALVARFWAGDSTHSMPPFWDVDDALGLVLVDIPQADDSIGSERYAVWYRPADDGTPMVERAYRIASCSRGVAAPDMCV